jgi:flagellar motor switch protein FliN/FliY
MPDDINVINKLEVIVSVRICETRMSMREVMSMTPGSIIELPTSAEGKLDVLVGGKSIGTGRAVKIGENFGVSIHKVGQLEAAEREDDDFDDSGDFDPEAFADALLAAQG